MPEMHDLSGRIEVGLDGMDLLARSELLTVWLPGHCWKVSCFLADFYGI